MECYTAVEQKKGYSLSCDSKNAIHLGNVITIITDNNTGEIQKTIRININELIENIILGTKNLYKAKRVHRVISIN